MLLVRIFSSFFIFTSSVILAENHPLCAGFFVDSPDRRVAKLAQRAQTGTRQAIVIFAEFGGGNNASPVPSWAASIFDPEKPGSFAHFYDTMSFGQLHVRGAIAPRRYRSKQSSPAYISTDPSELGNFGQFNLEILQAADPDIDFSRYDNDGPDGIPNSGDDNGIVDAVFIVLDSIPRNFLLRAATGLASLGLEQRFITNDIGVNGRAIQIVPDQGTIQGGNSFSKTVGTLCHEYGHILGLPDLFNTGFIRQGDPSLPEDDSAGIGAWGLMGRGALGWNETDGPNSFCAWSRMQLGWAQVDQPNGLEDSMSLEDVGVRGALYKIPLSRKDFFLLEYRRRQSSYYDRNLPEEGLLIWHIEHTRALSDVFRLDNPDRCGRGRLRDIERGDPA